MPAADTRGLDAGGEPPVPDRKLLEKLLRFIQVRPRTCGETRERARRWGYGGDEAEQAVVYLESRGLIDDEAFARQFLEELIRKGYGERRIREKLFAKRLGREAIDAAMDEYPYELEAERALEAAGSAAGKMNRDDPRAFERKMYSLLLRKGFASSAARQACRHLGDIDSEIGPE